MYSIFVTFSVLKFDKATEDKEKQFATILPISTTFWVLNFNKSNDFNDLLLWNKELIFVTLLVSKFETFNADKLTQW